MSKGLSIEVVLQKYRLFKPFAPSSCQQTDTSRVLKHRCTNFIDTPATLMDLILVTKKRTGYALRMHY